jgi:hypothetical protein
MPKKTNMSAFDAQFAELSRTAKKGSGVLKKSLAKVSASLDARVKRADAVATYVANGGKLTKAQLAALPEPEQILIRGIAFTRDPDLKKIGEDIRWAEKSATEKVGSALKRLVDGL